MNVPTPGNQGVLLNTVTYPELYDALSRSFIPMMDRVTPAARQLFIEEDAPIPSPNIEIYNEFDVDTFSSRKSEGQGTTAARMALGYQVTMTPLRFGKKVVVTEEDRIHNKYREVRNAFTGLANYGPERIELDLTHILTFATSSTYTNMDGEVITVTVGDSNPLVYAAHTLKHSALTYSNRLSGDPLPSKGAIQAMKVMLSQNILSNFGQKRMMKFDTIFCADNQVVIDLIRQTLESSSDTTQNNSGVKNVFAGDTYKLVVLPYLATTAAGVADSTKINWWGMVATGGAGGNRWQAYIRYWQRPHLRSPEEGNTKNGDTDTWEFHARDYRGIRAVTGRGLGMSCPTS